MLRHIRTELRPMLRLSIPVIMAELGWMGMGIVDTIMVGRLGAAATGAVGLGNNLHFGIVVFGMGLLLGLDTIVSQAHGAGKHDEAARSLTQGLYLGLIVAPLLMLTIEFGIQPRLSSWGFDPSVLRETVPYLRVLTWSTWPLLVYAAFRRFLQGIGLVRPVTFALVSANLINLFGNWALIEGHLGLPRLGVTGSGYATLMSRIYMAGVLAFVAIRYERQRVVGSRFSFAFDRGTFARLFRLGLPASVQATLEVGVFAVCTALAGQFAATSLAAHQIVLSVSSLTYMVPLGISSAAAVRVGQAVGKHSRGLATAAGWTSLVVGACFMSASGLVFLTIPEPLARIFTRDPLVIQTARTLLAIAAAFQLFDGIQIVATGALRGLGETRLPMLCNLLAYWIIGLPLGAWLAFPRGWGVTGLWTGLSAGLIVAGVILLMIWARATRWNHSDTENAEKSTH